MSNIEKIRQEIERRKKGNMYDELPTTIGRYYEDRDLLAFIDSLPEEKSSEDLEEARKQILMNYGGFVVGNLIGTIYMSLSLKVPSG